MRWERGKPYCLPSTSGGEGRPCPEPEERRKASAVQGVAPVPHRPSRSGVDGGQPFYVSAKGRRLSGQALADFEAFWDAYGYRRGKAEAADMWLAATRKAPELVPVIIRAASAAAAEHEELAARVKGRIRMYAENWLQGRRWEDFEAGGFLPLPPADGETEPVLMPECATCRPTWGQGAGKERPPRRPCRKGGLYPRPGTPERQGLKPCRPRADFPHDRRGGFPVAGWFERLFQIRRSVGLPSRSSCWIWPRAWKARCW